MALEEPLRGPIDDIEKKMRVLAKPMRTRACAERGDDGAAVDGGGDDGGGDAEITKLKRNCQNLLTYTPKFSKIKTVGQTSNLTAS